MCTSAEVLPTPEDAKPEIPIDEFTASALGLKTTVEQLIGSGVDINKTNIEGWSMLQYASFIGHTNLVHFLLEQGADPNVGACSSLMLAARCGNEPILIALLSKGASLEQVDNSGLTALQHAVSCGQDGSVTVLMRHSKRITPSESNVLLHSAVSHASVAVLKALLDGGLVPSSATRLSMIEMAHTRGDNDLLQLVVSCGNTPTAPRHAEDPFNRYLQRGPLEMQKMLQQQQQQQPPRYRRPGSLGIQMSPGLNPVLSPGVVTPGLNMGLNAVSPMQNSPASHFSPPTFNSVEDALSYLKLEKYSVLFEREDVDMQTFLTLTDADLKAISIDLLGPRKKILNFIKMSQTGGGDTGELQMALAAEQNTVHALREKLKQDRENEAKNQQIIQSLFMSYQNIRESKDKILTTLTNASFVIQHIQEELTSCKEMHERLPRFSNALNNSDSSSIFASSWPCSKDKTYCNAKEQSEDMLGEHIAMSSVNSVLESSPYKDDKPWSWDDCTSGSSSSTLNASYSVDKLRKHIDSAAIYTCTLYQQIQDSKQVANNISTFNGLG